jgi:RNA methyltransferase, TrmH family
MAVVISSRTNAAVKRWKAIAARDTLTAAPHLVWVEGEHLVQEAIAAGLEVAETILCEGVLFAAGGAVTHVSRDVMAAVSQLETPPTVAALVALRIATQQPVTQNCLVLDGVQDPGNVGTMMRCAWAFGIRHVVLTLGCASPWSMKTLRAGQGAQFHLQVYERVEIDQLPQLVRVPLVVTALAQSQSIASAKLPSPCAWVFGHEGRGVSELLRKQAQLAVRIDMPGGAESLNVAAACAICLYEQQRRLSMRM